MESKLGLDFKKVGHAKELARKIADGVQGFVEQYTTVAVERTLCRLLGIDGVDANTVPLPNVLVSELKEKGVLGQGVLFFLGNAIISTGKDPQEIAEAVGEGELDIPVCRFIRQRRFKRLWNLMLLRRLKESVNGSKSGQLIWKI